MTFIVVSGIAISLFVLFHLLRQKEQHLLSRQIAMAIQLLWLIRFALFYVKIDQANVQNPFLIVYDQTLFLLDGLLVWMYVKALLQPGKFSWKTALHSIPFLLFFSYATLIAVFEPDAVVAEYSQTIRKFESKETILIPGVVFFIVLMLGVNIIYLVKSVKISRVYNDALKENLSTIDHLTVNWVQKFQRLWIILFIIPVLLYFVNYMIPVTGRLTLGYFFIVPLVLLSIVFNSYLLQQVYSPVSVFHAVKPGNAEMISRDNQERLFKLETLMSKEKYYLDDELSLAQLAGHMEMKPAAMTELIKFSTYDNFYDLVNSYRIEEVKHQLRNTDEQIIQLAYQNGFRSKSTFNKIFKEKTGMTPKQYREANK